MDRSFLSDDMDGNGLAAAIMVIGDQFGLEVVAEGIETRAQLESLRRLGFQLGQGFLFAGPMQDADLATYLRLAFAPRAA
jgi:EAL domain-containing protein (putative c-di-GMP-specific phosphodiesterase class I)